MEVWLSSSSWPWASDTIWAIAPRTWPNCPAVWSMLEKDWPSSWSFSWKLSASFSTPENVLPTRLSSEREATSFFTSSFWYSFRLSATCRTG